MSPITFQVRQVGTDKIEKVEIIGNISKDRWIFHNPDCHKPTALSHFFEDDFLSSGVWEFHKTPKKTQEQVMRICAARKL